MTDAVPLSLPVRSPELLARLRTRRSAPAQALEAPGPSDAELTQILEIGARTPDHGKLAPWRFVVMGPQVRARIAAELVVLAERKRLPPKAQAVLAKLTAAPLTVLVISSPVPNDKVPIWEQELSTGAVCMNLEHAAGAFGYSASWITDWYSFDPDATALFGVRAGERIAGFIHMGTLGQPPLERPRPDLSAIITRVE